MNICDGGRGQDKKGNKTRYKIDRVNANNLID